MLFETTKPVEQNRIQQNEIEDDLKELKNRKNK